MGQRLADIVKGASLLIANETGITGILSLVGQGRPVCTIHEQVTGWRQVRKWLIMQTCVPWTRGVADLVDYFQSRADEPCTSSARASLLWALAFMEPAPGECLSCGQDRSSKYRALLARIVAAWELARNRKAATPGSSSASAGPPAHGHLPTPLPKSSTAH